MKFQSLTIDFFFSVHIVEFINKNPLIKRMKFCQLKNKEEEVKKKSPFLKGSNKLIKKFKIK